MRTNPTLPTEEGYYWARFKNYVPEIVKVEFLKEGFSVRFFATPYFVELYRYDIEGWKFGKKIECDLE